MKILVLGENSFLAKEIKSYFLNDSRFEYVSRRDFNLEDESALTNFLKDKYYDFVINTCVNGGKRDVKDDFGVLASNLKMFNNLLVNKQNYGHLFLFCSGAAFDRRRGINYLGENDIFSSYPVDYYGLSKNLISREAYKCPNIINFRLFGCFGANEEPTRFIKNSLNNLRLGKDIEIIKDKYMDYFSAVDLCRVLEYYITHLDKIEYKDVNLVYKEKHKLSEIADKILSLTGTDKHVSIFNTCLDKAYAGNSDRLFSMPIKLLGLDKSLEDLIKCQT